MWVEFWERWNVEKVLQILQMISGECFLPVSLWNHLTDVDRKILTRFVKICSILVGRIVQFNLMDEADQKLVEIVKIIKQNYDRDIITPNLHLLLHLCECAKDFGPLYAFWYFSFKHINGVLGKMIFKNM